MTKLLKTLAVLILTLGGLAAYAQTLPPSELVLIVRNADTSRAVLAEDIASEVRIAGNLSGFVKRFNPNLTVEELEIGTLDDLDEQVLKKTDSRHLRGLIFLGHGNTSVYALNQDQMYTPETMAKRLQKIFNSPSVHGSFTIYFSGCKMAGTEKDKDTFQEILFRDLSASATETNPNLDLSVVAHSYGTDAQRGSFAKPIFLDVFAVKSRLGQFFQRYSMLLANNAGGYSPTLMNIVTLGSAIAFGLLVVPDYKQEAGAVGFALIGLTKLFSSSAEMLGKDISTKKRKRGFIYDLLKDRFACQTLLTNVDDHVLSSTNQAL